MLLFHKQFIILLIIMLPINPGYFLVILMVMESQMLFAYLIVLKGLPGLDGNFILVRATMILALPLREISLQV